MSGTLFLVVGPSGVGKDTLIAGARARLAEDPAFVFPPRTVTRPAEAGGEDHVAASPETFRALEAAGAFFFAWRAHGLAYGLPASIRDDLARRRHVVVNVSRRAIAEIAGLHPRLAVLSVTAAAETVRRRLEARGREDATAVAARLAREATLPPAGVPVLPVPNDGPVEDGVARLVATLRAAAGRPVSPA